MFDILIKGILFHSINRFSNQEIGKEWEAIYDDTFNKKQTVKLQQTTKKYLTEKFNPGLKVLLESIEKDTNIFMNYFGSNIKISLDFNEVKYHGRRVFSGNFIKLKIDFFEKHIPKHQFFLNEARLSALAISVYLASIKVNPTAGALKVLVLDDLLIGLDMGNRVPLLKILKNHFVDVNESEQFQIIMTTYDKIWYELVKSFFGNDHWKYIEIFSKSLENQDFEIPIIFNERGYIEKAKYYLAEKDYKASAVYIRTEFERLVKNICESRKLPVIYKKNAKDITSEDFWLAITTQTNLDKQFIKELEIHRGTVMNPFSHYDLEKPEFAQKLIDTIASIENLSVLKNLPNTNIDYLKKNITITQLENEITKLSKKNEEKDITIAKLRNVISKK